MLGDLASAYNMLVESKVLFRIVYIIVTAAERCSAGDPAERSTQTPLPLSLHIASSF
jgi:hypothetical protein